MKKLGITGRGWIFTGIGLVTGLYLLAYAANISPYLRGPDAWRWVYAIPGYPGRHLVPIVVVMAYSITILKWVHNINSRDNPPVHLFLGFAILSVPLIQAALLYPESPDVLRPLFYRTISAGASGVFSVGSTINDLGDFLRRYPSLMPTFPVHPQRYPPGLPVLFYCARKFFEVFSVLGDALGFALRTYQCHDFSFMRLSNATIASAVIQMSLPILSGLVVIPLYDLAKRTVGKYAAIWVVAIYPLLPSFALWSARWDQFYPLLSCTAAACFWRGLTDARLRYPQYALRIFFSGLLLSLAMFLSFGPLVILVPLALAALLWALPNRHRRQWGRLVGGAFIFIAGLVVPWIVYQIAFGTGFLDIWRVSMTYHLGLGREYGVWLFYHLYDFLSFLGLPIAMLFGAAVVISLKRGWKHDRSVLPLGFGLGLLLLDFSGTSRGEVARVWLFLTPFAVISAVEGLTQLKRQRWHTVLVIVLLAVQLLVFNAFLRVVTTGITDPPVVTYISSLSHKLHPFDARFGEQISLVAYDVEPELVQPGSVLQVKLTWQDFYPVTRPYTVYVHLLGQDGNLVTQHDSMPQSGEAPTTCWSRGDYIPDDHILAIPEDIKPGVYTLVTGLYYWETGERLPAEGTNVMPDGRVEITPITVKKKMP